ncbi:TIGR04066 family peptide maturation system protein [Clostridium sp. Marseille-Q2269]|uniref:TIGR04066 family peptide maturation system protein n=1 Tax=Clostridium sp. Marseille-Q2269 TaxID=2942205 RepID=UPI002073089F|nr:TIGR04066 family peptide maturation system protein [Clostridium sp. Marseille-Q2269]
MNKVMLYPYDMESLPIVKYEELITGLNIVSLVSPRGWGLTGREINNDNKSLRISDNFSEKLAECETVWFVDSKNDIDFNKFILPKIEEVNNLRKNIIYTRKFINKEEDVIKVNVPNYSLFKDNYYDCSYVMSQQLYDIDVPIIFVSGITEYTDKFDIQLAVGREFTERGYRVSNITSRKIGNLFRMYSIPDFMFDKTFTETEKILKFNYFVKEIEMLENPDLIILGIPQNILPLSRIFTGDMGVLGFEISQAVLPDCVILSVMYGEYDYETLLRIGKEASVRLGKDIDYYNICNRMIEVEDTEIKRKIQFLTLSNQLVFEKVDYLKNDNIYALNENKEISRLVDNIIKKLSTYREIQVI